jgi:hypothetical protein
VALPLDFGSPDGGLLTFDFVPFSLRFGLFAPLVRRRIGESLAGLDGCGVPGNVADQTVGPLGLQQQLVQLFADPLTGKLSKGARKRALARYLDRTLPAASTPQLFVPVEAIQRLSRGRQVVDRLGQKRDPHCLAVSGRAP